MNIACLLILSAGLAGAEIKSTASAPIAGAAKTQTVPGAGWNAKELVTKGQELLRGVKSSRARLEMNIVRPHFKRHLEIESFHEGKDKSYIAIHKPAKEKGSRTLRLKTDVWTYTLKTERAIKIPYSMMHTSWMGSDFTYEDMVKLDSFVKDYEHSILEKIPDPEKRGGWRVTILLTPLPEAPVIWGKVIWTAVVSEGNNEVIPVEEKDFNERGELVRRITLKDIKLMGGKRMPAKMTCEMSKKPGTKTELEYKEMAFDLEIPDTLFTTRSLEQGTR